VASVALLLLWETEHDTRFPCNAVGLAARIRLFTERLVGAVAADPELRAWLLHRKVWTPLTPGLPCQPHTQWGVQVLNRVGDPFNSAWKAHLAFLASQQQSCTTTSASLAPQQRVVAPPAAVASASGSSPSAKRQLP
jgi:hypothetical protein